MKQLFILFLAVLGSLSLSAQNLTDYLAEQNLKTKTTPEGIHYSFEKKGKGTTPEIGDCVKLTYRATLLDGAQKDQNPGDQPFVFEVGYRQVIRGLDRGIQLFPEGSKGTLYIPAKLAYGNLENALDIPAGADLIYDIEVLEVMDYAAYDEYMRELEVKEKADFLRREKAQAVQDKQIIKEYVQKEKLRVTELPSGVAYVITKKGKGAAAGKNTLVEMNYEGYLPNGEYFDGEGRKNFKFWLGRGMVIEGLEQAVPFFSAGAEGIILVPSKYAYGQRSIKEGENNVPSNSVLIFDIKVDKISRF